MTMDLTLLFALTVTLTFTVQFGVNDGLQQDYFMLQGDNQTAHLHRRNQTLYLHLVQEDSLEIYMGDVKASNFNFSWTGYTINGRPMSVIKKSGNVSTMHFKQFTFISPVYDSFEDLECRIETHHEKRSRNYWYIVGIAIFAVIICKTNALARRVITAPMKQEDRELFNQTADLVEDILTTVTPQSLTASMNDDGQ